jgi:hypothetical protein
MLALQMPLLHSPPLVSAVAAAADFSSGDHLR